MAALGPPFCFAFEGRIQKKFFLPCNLNGLWHYAYRNQDLGPDLGAKTQVKLLS